MDPRIAKRMLYSSLASTFFLPNKTSRSVTRDILLGLRADFNSCLTLASVKPFTKKCSTSRLCLYQEILRIYSAQGTLLWMKQNRLPNAEYLATYLHSISPRSPLLQSVGKHRAKKKAAIFSNAAFREGEQILERLRRCLAGGAIFTNITEIAKKIVAGCDASFLRVNELTSKQFDDANLGAFAGARKLRQSISILRKIRKLKI